MTRQALVLALLCISIEVAGAQAVPRLNVQEVARIAATDADGEMRFGTATWATRLPSGEIVVADGAELTLRFFSLDARELRRFGRRGRGPREFATLGWIASCGEGRLFAWDFGLARPTALNPAAVLDTTWVHPSARQEHIACAPDGRVLAAGALQRTAASRPSSTGMRDGTGYRLWTDTTDAHLFSPTGQLQASWPDVLRRESIAGTLADGRGGMLRRPLGVQGFLLFLGSEPAILNSSGGLTWLGSGRVQALAGGAAAPPSAAAYRAALESGLRQVPASAWEQFRMIALAAPPPDSSPRVFQVIPAVEGGAWVRISSDGEPPRLIQVDSSGRSAELRLPIWAMVFEIGRDYVLGRTEDEDGEQTVVLWTLRR